MKRTALVFSAFVLVLPVAAARGAKPAKAPKAAPEAQAPAFDVSSATPQNTAELIAHFQEIDKNLQSLSASFTQSLTMAEAGLNQRVEGNLEYLKPNRLRLEHFKPERQTIVSDGDKIWIYRAAQNQVIESSLADWKKSDPLINDLLDFGDYSRMLAAYEVSYDSAALQVTLRPKSRAEQPFVLKLKLSGPYLFPLETELVVAQTQVRTSLSTPSFNPKIAEERFRFAPPKGAQVFDRFKPPVRAREMR